MFPSSGFFADIDCPFTERGLCERPHCPYRHATGTTEQLDSRRKSPLTDSAGGVPGGCAENGSPAGHQTQDVCLSELERLDKEIETVRHEVEQEQRRLTFYRTGQTGGRSSQNASTITTSESQGQNSDKSSCKPPLSTGTTEMYFQTGKYVVDNSKPRTDLEYDPLSNFSAGLHSGLKKARDPEPDHTKAVACKARPPRSPSPEPHDDLMDDCVLIIDIPSSPDANGGAADHKKPLDSGADRPAKDPNLYEVEEAVPRTLPEQLARPDGPKLSAPSTSDYAKENKRRAVFFESGAYKNLAANGRVEPQREKCVAHRPAEMEAKKITESGPVSALTEPLVRHQENPFRLQFRQCETSHAAEALTLVELFAPRNPLFCKAPVVKAQPQCSQQGEPPARNRAAENKAPPPSCLEVAEPGSSLAAGRLSDSTHGDVVLIKSSSDDDDDDDDDDKPNYSELDLSDSDPMEECYRIFMEDNNKEKGTELPQTPAAVESERSEVKLEPQEVAGKKRMSHEPVAPSRAQPQALVPQVLVPLRTCAPAGLVSQPLPVTASKIQQGQQRACVPTALVKGAQTVVATANQRRPDSGRAPPCVMQPAPVPNAYVNCLPVGTAVIEVGNNLHLILSKGAFPVPASSSAVTTVLTPIGHVQTSAGPVKESYLLPAAVAAAQRCRTAATVLIPAPARRPALASAFPPAHSAPAAPTAAPASHASVKLPPLKRKLKQQCEAAKEKVPHNVRQRYVNMFTEEFLKTTANVNEAFEKALAEERTVYNRSVNKLKYLSVAVNALKRLKNQNAVAAKDNDECNNQRLPGSIPLNLKKCKGNGDAALYDSLKAYILPEEKLIESNYPVQHPEKRGCAVLFADNKRGSTDAHKRICCRCGATYSVSPTGKHTRKEECNYHYGKGVTKRVPGGVETRYSCCEGVMGAPGCQVFKLHVHDALSLEGFVQTAPRRPPDGSCPGVYSLDCEMCYTIQGLELSRVTLVNSSLQVVYDTFVQPDNEVIDYNTRFSGVSEEDVKGHHTSLCEVQETLLSFINADTILIGHSLEMDLCALKLLHGTVVDTSVVFPHRLGPPNKLTLNNLTADYLRRIIQESVCGHDTAEDATACMELMLWKIKEDGKMKTSGNKT